MKRSNIYLRLSRFIKYLRNSVHWKSFLIKTTKPYKHFTTQKTINSTQNTNQIISLPIKKYIAQLSSKVQVHAAPHSQKYTTNYDATLRNSPHYLFFTYTQTDTAIRNWRKKSTKRKSTHTQDPSPGESGLRLFSPTEAKCIRLVLVRRLRWWWLDDHGL